MSIVRRSARRALPLSIALAFSGTGAQAASITVTTGDDAGTAGTCTLRQAILSANNDAAGASSCVAGSGADTIVFAASLQNSTITLAGEQLDIESPMTIVGSGQTIDGDNDSRVLYVYNNIGAVTLSNLTITNGNAGDDNYGGGIEVEGDRAESEQQSRAARRHGGKATRAYPASTVLTLDHLTITNNRAGYGAGVSVDYATFAMDQSIVSANVSDDTENNYSTGGLAFANSNATITNSTISGNIAAGGQYITGGIYNFRTSLTITNSTISGNTAAANQYGVGGITDFDPGEGNLYDGVQLFDSTISGNSATGAGTYNTGGVLVGSNGPGFTYSTNTIISGNTGTNPDVFVEQGEFTASASLLGTALSSAHSGNGNIFSDQPKLGALANNGGPTQTMALLTGSPAINAGNNSLVPAGLATDQRGTGYVRIFGSAVDIGAFEVVAAPTQSGTIAVPTLSRWALALLGGLLAAMGLLPRFRRR